MAEYSLEQCDKIIDELTDKMGSDYFPIDVKLNRFKIFTYDFIRSNTTYLEATQEISDDLKHLLVQDKLTLIKDYSNHSIWTLPEPDDYLRLVSILPLFIDPVDSKEKTKAKRVYILKEGQRNAYQRDPFRKPTSEYPSVFRRANLFEINVGSEDTTEYEKAFIIYVKKPKFATVQNMNDTIVDLNDLAITQILSKTADSFRFTTENISAASNYNFDLTFGKRNK